MEIAENTQIIKDDSNPLIYLRHPFTWLVEAADDICYNIIDFEDAHRLGIVEHSHCIDLLSYLVSCIGIDDIDKLNVQLDKIKDRNDKISYLRAKSISTLTIRAKTMYEENIEEFSNGTVKKSIFDSIKEDCGALTKIIDFSKDNIYNDRNVVEIENAGYNVMYELFSHFVTPILKAKNERTHSNKKAIQLLLPTFNCDGEKVYERVLGVLD